MRIEDRRAEIDEIDAQLLRLLNKRALLAAQLGALKSAAGLPISDVERERHVLEQVCRANTGPLDGLAITKLFRRIIRESRCVEARVAENFNA